MSTAHVLARCTIAAFAFAATSGVEARGRCQPQLGQGSGVTLSIAKLKTFQYILKATDNWPDQKGFIFKPIYKCVGFGGSWNCAARATICKP